MDCRKVRKLLNRYLEADLPEELGLRIEGHLDACKGCCRERDLLEASWQLLGSYQSPRVSADFTASVVSRIGSDGVGRQGTLQGDTRREASRGMRWRWAVAVAACVLVAVGVGIALAPSAGDENDFWFSSIERRNPVRSVTDDEIIQDLELYENLDLLDNLGFLSDFDVIEDFEEAL